MSPRAGLFSADSWTLVTTILRNLILNWFVLVPLIAAAMLVPRVHYALIHLSQPDPDPMARYRLSGPETAALVVALAGYLVSLGYAVADLPSYGNRRLSERRFIGRCLVPLCLGTLSLTYFWALNQVDIPLWIVLTTSAVAHAAVWILVGFLTGNRPFRPRTWLAAAAGGVLVGLGIATA